MGKPFNQELKLIYSVIDWSFSSDTSKLSSFLFDNDSSLIIVGSGGSISAAHLLGSLLRLKGKVSQVLTPLELYHTKDSIQDERILLLSASGRNKDIRFGLKTALYSEPASIGCLTMTTNNPLLNEAARYSICVPIEYEIPTGKDGFLATNTLIATWAILLKSFGYLPSELIFSHHSNAAQEILKSIIEITTDIRTIIVIYGKWGQPVAIDIESKCTEAALLNIQMADFRNFGHGRHHWIAKHPDNTVVVALVSPEEQRLCEKTLSLLPANIPRILIKTQYEDPLAYLDLLVQSYYLIEALGRKVNIDPGKPGVPEFGRQLYHVNPATYLKFSSLNTRDLAIRRKIRRITGPTNDLKNIQGLLENAYQSFIERLKAAKFSSIVTDYDGTLCAKERRFLPLSDAITERLIRHLKKGFLIGIATGRGRSVQENLRKAIPTEFWKQVLVGYYNGSVILPLADDLPDVTNVTEPVLVELEIFLKTTPYNNLPIDARSSQLTITTKNEATNAILMDLLNSYCHQHQLSTAIIQTSGSSIDVIVKGSKSDVVKSCQKLATKYDLHEDCLCIGDKGNYPGNDFNLLASPYSLSVDEVSTNIESCWNLAGLGIRNEQACIEYLDSIIYLKSHFYINLLP